MRLLVLGGTHFLGRAVVSAALARRWDVTIFRRGTSGEDPADVRGIRGDYTNPRDLARLAEAGPWDAVVDTLAFVPRETLAVAKALKNIVLDAPSDAGPDFGCYDGDPGPSTYGFGKAGCGRAVTETFGDFLAACLKYAAQNETELLWVHG